MASRKRLTIKAGECNYGKGTAKKTAKPKRRTMAKAFDEWMRRFVEEPEKYEQTLATVKRFVKEDGMEGKPTSYGESCTAFLKHLMAGG